MHIDTIESNDYDELIKILNSENLWRRLGKIIGYNNEALDMFLDQSVDSPAGIMLDYWKKEDHTIEELFLHLKTIGMYSCCSIKDFFTTKTIKKPS